MFSTIIFDFYLLDNIYSMHSKIDLFSSSLK